MQDLTCHPQLHVLSNRNAFPVVDTASEKLIQFLALVNYVKYLRFSVNRIKIQIQKHTAWYSGPQHSSLLINKTALPAYTKSSSSPAFLICLVFLVFPSQRPQRREKKPGQTHTMFHPNTLSAADYYQVREFPKSVMVCLFSNP